MLISIDIFLYILCDSQVIEDCFDDCVRLVSDIMEGRLDCPDPVVKDNDKIFDIWFEGL